MASDRQNIAVDSIAFVRHFSQARIAMPRLVIRR